MKEEYNLNNKKRVFLLWTIAVFLSVIILIVLEYFNLKKVNMQVAYKNSEELIRRIEDVFEENKRKERELIRSLKEVYSLKAQTVAYIIDKKNGKCSKKELDKIKELLEVDEIHLFNEKGVICNGTLPQYYGLNFDSGEQMRYFEPMLKDKTLKMNQSLSLNTAEGKMIMYSICWNKTGNMMVQVGITPHRLLKRIKENKIENIVAKIPQDAEKDIIITLRSSDKIITSTKKRFIGKKLAEIGIYFDNKHSENVESGFKDMKMYCSMKKYDKYKIIIVQYKKDVNKNVYLILLIFTKYLMLIFILMTFLIDYMYDKCMKEQINSLKDNLTDMFNRREYENVFLRYKNKEIEENLCFLAMDINGLKQVNDTLGHGEGDRLIKGAASCIKQEFGAYGDVFRIGGDEFLAIIFIERNRIDDIITNFKKRIKKWSKENAMDLSLSLGFAFKKEYPDRDMRELSRIADKKMYENKVKYYNDKNNNRRNR